MITSLVLLLRPRQWVKNLFVFLPVLVSLKNTVAGCWIPCLCAFIAFCLISSAVYCFNDIHDVAADRLHPKKCHRPIASGKVSRQIGYILMVVCILLSFGVICLPSEVNFCNIYRVGILSGYLLMNVAYCLWLKKVAILDVFTIAFGFVLRILLGGLMAHLWISHWIVLMTFLLTLFLAFAKRRDEVLIYVKTRTVVRHNVVRYSLSFLDQMMSIVASVMLVCYVMYTVSPEVMERIGSSYLYLTSVFVFGGIFRYLQITVVDMGSGSPTEVFLKDRFLQCCLLGWLLSFSALLYL